VSPARSGIRPADVTVGIPTRNRSRLLERAIQSVLRQSYGDFTLLVSDNASEDDTARTAASFEDSRIVYRPTDRAISRPENFNRLIDLSETEFLVMLSDDDELHPDHLALTLDALKHRPRAGMAHTSYSIVDMLGDPIFVHPDARRTDTEGVVRYESGPEFIDRAMRSGPTVCLSSAVFRRAALAGAGGLQPEDGGIDDFSLQLRIATDWDFAYLPRELAYLRAHTDADSSALGAFTPKGFRSSRELPDLLRENRRRFLASGRLPSARVRRLARATERTYRRDVLSYLSMRATTGDRSLVVFRAFAEEVRRLPRLAWDPFSWRFVIGQLGARRVRDSIRGWRSGPGPERRTDLAN
jgi:cellulose synthase/poly-beta-1,6-N-acetylglucosamine synthase-like glycosyltransferase